MTQIPKVGNDVKRSKCLIFDINSDVSYDNFCNNKQFQSQIETIDNHFVLEDGFHFVGQFFCVGSVLSISLALGMDMMKQSGNFLSLVSQLFKFDIKETFQNLSQEKVKKIQTIINGLDGEIKEDAIDIIQKIFVICDELDVPYFGNDLILHNVTENENAVEGIMLELRGTRYNVDKVPNKRLYYTLFQIFTQREPVFLAYNGNGNLLVCSADYLYRNIDSASIVYNLSSFLYENISPEMKQNMLELKDKYQSSHLLEMYIKEIVKQFETVKNIEIKTLSKEFDTNKRTEIDKNLPNADIGFKKHKGEKKYIKVERTFKLKKK